MDNDEILKVIHKFCLPEDLVIHQKLAPSMNYRWFWEYREAKSEDLYLDGFCGYDISQAGFASPLEAFAHFTSYMMDVHENTLKTINDLDCSVSFASPVVQIDNSVVEAIADLQLTAKGKRKVV